MPFFSNLFRGRKRPVWLFVEGNVGSGKTTVMCQAKDMLSERGYTVLTLTENVDRWKEQHLLTDMYASDLNRSSVRAFQVLGCLRDHIEREKYLRAHGEKFDVIIQERHPSTTLEAFSADSCVCEMYDLLNVGTFIPQHSIYLKTNAEECLRRVKSRKRRGEHNINLRYLRHLDTKHEEMMARRLNEGGNVYEICTANLSNDETAARVCDVITGKIFLT